MYSPQVLPILRQIRPLVMPQWGKAAIIHQKNASATTIVTELDTAVEKFVAAELARFFPHIAFAGEETGGSRDHDQLWLMDPIDGTQHFVRGLPFCTSMLALIEHDTVIFSAIYDFVNDDMYWAERGHGAFRNTETLHVSRRSLKESYICTEIRRDNDTSKAMYQALFDNSITFQSINAGWEMAMIASGKLDARVCYLPWGNDYDYAPGSLLVSEAGGTVANIGSDTYNFRNTNLIAANPTIYHELTSGTSAIFSKEKFSQTTVQ